MLSTRSLTFPKSARILKSAHFRHLSKGSRRVVGQWMALDFRKGRAPSPKLGLTVSKRYGKAHDRNRFKRLVRESFRHTYPDLPDFLEINVHPRKSHPEISYDMILSDFLHLIKSIHDART